MWYWYYSLEQRKRFIAVWLYKRVQPNKSRCRVVQLAENAIILSGKSGKYSQRLSTHVPSLTKEINTHSTLVENIPIIHD